MDAPITPFVEQLSALDALEYKLQELGSTEPAKAYLLANAIDKVATRAKKDFSKGFKKYFDEQKELPGWFECKVIQWATKYAFDQDPVWLQIKATLDAREATLKAATDLKMKWGTFTDPNTGEIVDGVEVSWNATSYRVTRK